MIVLSFSVFMLFSFFQLCRENVKIVVFGHGTDMLPGISHTSAGVVYLMEKQEDNYAYVRP